MIAAITRTYLRHYTDNGQRTLYVEWRDGRGKTGRTECDAERSVSNAHMRSLLARAARENVALERETW